ncbi:MAG: helix-turn-helix transcriptional regulator [Desulfuromonadales bacterium]|nr:helix-turn-helix transcriptional regulator [Desulfuromonadales bacterium]
MQEHTKTHPIEARFTGNPGTIDRLRNYAKEIGAEELHDVTADEFFNEHFQGESRSAVTLRGYRHREGLTQVQLATAAGVPRRHLSEMENSKRPIGKATARRLAAVLNCDYRMLL